VCPVTDVLHLIREDERHSGGAMPAGPDLHAAGAPGPDQAAGSSS
jgi:hypothetical protein